MGEKMALVFFFTVSFPNQISPRKWRETPLHQGIHPIFPQEDGSASFNTSLLHSFPHLGWIRAWAHQKSRELSRWPAPEVSWSPSNIIFLMENFLGNKAWSGIWSEKRVNSTWSFGTAFPSPIHLNLYIIWCSKMEKLNGIGQCLTFTPFCCISIFLYFLFHCNPFESD